MATDPSASVFSLAAAETADAQLARHREWLRTFEDAAEAFAAAGQPEDAVAAAAVGARIALEAHPGVMASPRLERVLTDVAARHLEPVERAKPPARPARRVLHIVTETYPTGGHSRVLWRWISRDRGRVHTVVATRQADSMPKGLRAAVRATGGRVLSLDPHGSVLARAQQLRELVAQADVVVINAHTFDPIPTLALSALPGRPPTVMFDHAGYAFWLGRSVADVIVGGPAEPHTATLRRGIAPERYFGLPFPAGGKDGNGRNPAKPVPSGERATARRNLLRRLGWPQDTVLLLAVGAGYKFRGAGGTGMLDLVAPVLERHERARLLAIGPEHSGQWEELAQRTGGRVRALGLCDGIGPVFAAADVYLDPRLFAGNGAAGEAASYGLPVLTLAATPLEGELSCAHPVFGAHQETDVAGYLRTLQRLIEAPDERARMGEEARKVVAAADLRWSPGVEEAYARAAALGPVDFGQLAVPSDAPEPVDRLVHLQNQATGRDLPLEQIEHALAAFELAASHPAVRSLYGTLCGHAFMPELHRSFPSVFAAPAAHPEALRSAVSEFARCARAGVVAGQFVLGLRPEHAEAAVPVLEAALAEHPALTVDLVLDTDMQRARPAGALELVAA